MSLPRLRIACAAVGCLLTLLAAAPAQAELAPHYASQVVITRAGDSEPRLRELDGDISVADAVERLQARPAIKSVEPNYRLHRTGFSPNDPGRGNAPGGWSDLQWDFLELGAPSAWDELISVGAPGAEGVTVAVIDDGIAYRNHSSKKKTPRRSWKRCTKKRSGSACLKRCKRQHRGWGRARCRSVTRKTQDAWRSPDFTAKQFVPGHDFVDRDRFPDDRDGHGTHVAGTIASATDNGRYVAGLAYNAKLMPVRVLGSNGKGGPDQGGAFELSSGIRWAVDHGADVINMSLAFAPEVKAADVPSVVSAIAYAEAHQVVVVAAAGNDGKKGTIDVPASIDPVLSVGATGRSNHLTDYSNGSEALDLSAPGGDSSGKIWQMTFATFGHGSDGKFALRGWEGTSMATPHVSAVAAAYIAKQRALGSGVTAADVRERLTETADCANGEWVVPGQILTFPPYFIEGYTRCIGLDMAAVLGVGV